VRDPVAESTTSTRTNITNRDSDDEDQKILKNICLIGHPIRKTERYGSNNFYSPFRVNDMKASVMKKFHAVQQSPKDVSSQRVDFGQDKGSKSEPFYIAAIGNDRRSLARAMQFDRRR
jgi:hypothetical protein